MTPEDQSREEDRLFQKEVDLCVPSWNIPEPYSDKFYKLCEEIESDPTHGLNNGSTALYWHMVSVLHMHWGKRKS